MRAKDAALAPKSTVSSLELLASLPSPHLSQRSLNYTFVQRFISWVSQFSTLEHDMSLALLYLVMHRGQNGTNESIH